MGSLWSAPPPQPDFDLVPPQMRPSKDHVLDRLPVSPLTSSFGGRDFQKMIQELAPSDGSGIVLSHRIEPDVDDNRPPFSIKVSPGDTRNTMGVELSAFSKSLQSNPDPDQLGKALWSARAGMGMAGVVATAATFSPSTGMGGYASVRFKRHASSDLSEAGVAATDPRALGMGCGPTIDDGFSPVSNPSAAAGAPSVELGGRLVGRAGSIAGQPLNLATGFHTSPFEDIPLKLWMVGDYSRRWRAGVQVSMQAKAAAARLAEQNKPANWGGAGDMAEHARRFLDGLVPAVDASVSYRRGTEFEVSAGVDGVNRDIVTRYLHRTSLLRPSFNPVSKEEGIYNSVDIGVELRQPVDLRDPDRPPSLRAGVAWQANKHWLFKARAGTEGLGASVAMRSWTSPDAKAAVGISIPTPGTAAGTVAPTVGFQLSLGDSYSLEEVEYRDPHRRHTQMHAPSRRVVATPNAGTGPRVTNKVFPAPEPRRVVQSQAERGPAYRTLAQQRAANRRQAMEDML